MGRDATQNVRNVIASRVFLRRIPNPAALGAGYSI